MENQGSSRKDDSWWQRITQTSQPPPLTGAALQGGPNPAAALYEDFADCLNAHKHRAFLVAWVITIPWSWKTKDLKPFVIGTMMALVPDAFYANYRCDEQYRLFQTVAAAHANAAAASQAAARASQGEAQSSAGVVQAGTSAGLSSRRGRA